MEEAALGTSPGGSGCSVSVVKHPNLVVLGGYVVSALTLHHSQLILLPFFSFQGLSEPE